MCSALSISLSLSSKLIIMHFMMAGCWMTGCQGGAGLGRGPAVGPVAGLGPRRGGRPDRARRDRDRPVGAVLERRASPAERLPVQHDLPSILPGLR